ncbi:hypothetical protein DAPPUDRAFT_253368 [Daphnia pulex]|uniref:Uncharacterized protein n=1 Tax=Daphnia pulex TaxID=6669 RepID=E9H4P0_DAPPU|nr:hypothetical protein DAPPUDRAFT_253368 [Daphnia pulex]|eukprot:EFX73180.1 hypothetical protein DAPPUDRAFT_253368 [Daphnia pulex]
MENSRKPKTLTQQHALMGYKGKPAGHISLVGGAKKGANCDEVDPSQFRLTCCEVIT